MKILLKKFLFPRIQKKLFRERYGEPIIYQIVAFFVLIFGDFKTKIDYDLIPRLSYAFGIKDAFEIAKQENTKKILLIEFGVASGGGLFNIAKIAKKLSKIYKIDYEVIGFDTGKGLPPPLDYRDHPEAYFEGDFPPLKLDNSQLPQKTKLIYGNIKDTINDFCKNFINTESKIGFVSIDVDYYSSTVDCLEIFKMPANNYLSRVSTYCDDITHDIHNQFCGILLAINEFNNQEERRKISKREYLRYKRIFKTPIYLDQMYYVHIFDHQIRSIKTKLDTKKNIIKNYEI